MHVQDSRIYLLAAVLVIGGCSQPATIPKVEPPAPKDEAAPLSLTAEDPSRLDSETLDRVKEATVLIGNFEGGNLTSTGSGFVVGDGKRIVTNKHVVTGSDDKPDALKLVFWSGTDKARVVQVKTNAVKPYGNLKRDNKDYHREDLACITIGAKVSEPLELSPEPNLQETMPVWAFGFPRGTNILSDQDMPSVTVHTLRLERVEKAKNVVTLLQVSGSPTHGNSGGPIVDSNGQVLGVLQAKDVDAPILFAIPSVRVEKMLAGKKPGSQSVASLFKKPLEEPESNALKKDRKNWSSDAGPRQSYASALNISELTSGDLAGMSAFQLTLLRNEPFARRGYIFKRSDLRRAFATLSWYSPRTRNLAAVQRLLTRLERHNVDFVKSYQRYNGLDD